MYRKKISLSCFAKFVALVLFRRQKKDNVKKKKLHLNVSIVSSIIESEVPAKKRPSFWVVSHKKFHLRRPGLRDRSFLL